MVRQLPDRRVFPQADALTQRGGFSAAFRGMSAFYLADPIAFESIAEIHSLTPFISLFHCLSITLESQLDQQN